ncbi:hypothetical protein LJB63_23250, partial [[Eubacterium] rectale]|nr:hypothetical protein [Agathobacter rectalis]
FIAKTIAPPPNRGIQDEFLDFITQLKTIIQLYKLTITPKTTNIQKKIILITIFYPFQLRFIIFLLAGNDQFYCSAAPFFFPVTRQNF